MTPEQELKAKLEANKADLKAVTANREKLEQELAELEAKKPKHGDYGIDHEGDPVIVLEKNESNDLMTACMVEGGGLQRQGVAEEKWLPNITYGNLVDDLKALQEDVTDGEFYHPAGVLMVLKGDVVHFGKENYLRQMQATIKRNEL
jgi:hypothetical protein